MAKYSRYQLASLHGQSSVLCADLKSKISIGHTIEADLIQLIGEPVRYYLSISNPGNKCLFYYSITKAITVRSYPRFLRARPSTRQESFESREWFLISNGIVIKHLSVDKKAADPDLGGYIPSDGSAPD